MYALSSLSRAPSRSAKDNPPVTFAIAACQTQNVTVTVLPNFGLAGENYGTAKDMWDTMVQVSIHLPPFWCTNWLRNVNAYELLTNDLISYVLVFVKGWRIQNGEF